eukprot:gnl/TRDRNA2_/TRDRNA2_133288_c0_seq1.p2 gnl/TRDRNA2_/TRDRNA2_133288_c0~~gnl/TRDRNA2_/TRDRNA2_133288_c0_seq1.p2  ORF type:complete len:327 (-),score=62.48 gnl/TRDRNA2_/TRDRNA2_133288_c0_seq1:167-1147(-)
MHDSLLNELCASGLITTAYELLAREAAEVEPAADGVLTVSCTVQLRGLKARTDLNGRIGEVTQHDAATGRFEVLLSGGVDGSVRCRPENLSVLVPAVATGMRSTLVPAEKNKLLETCSAIRLCTWHWCGDAAHQGLRPLQAWIAWSATCEPVEAAVSEGQAIGLVSSLDKMSECAPLLMWAASCVGTAALRSGLRSLKDAAFQIARQLEDPLLTEGAVDALVDFLLEDLTARSGYFSRALLALKQRRARAGIEGVDPERMEDVIAVCDLFREHVESSEQMRIRISMKGSPECSFTLACELIIDLFLAIFAEHVQSLSVARPAALED